MGHPRSNCPLLFGKGKGKSQSFGRAAYGIDADEEFDEAWIMALAPETQQLEERMGPQLAHLRSPSGLPQPPTIADKSHPL